jgi:hypothetical protein
VFELPSVHYILMAYIKLHDYEATRQPVKENKQVLSVYILFIQDEMSYLTNKLSLYVQNK